MNSFFNKMGRFILNVMVICLVLLISYQIIIKTDTANPALRKMGNIVQNYLNRDEVEESVTVVEKKDYGVITIDLMQNYSLPEVWVLKNQNRAVNFAKGIVTINVQNGDYISIDARNYEGVLWFEITSLSEDIKNWSEGTQIRTAGSMIDMGIVEIIDKL